VTYNTMVAFDNPDLKLFPGMTAYISIPVAEAKNVVKIPNGALRFKPDLTDSERTALYAKYGINDAARATAAGRIAATAADGAAANNPGGAAATNGPATGQTPAGQGGQDGTGGGGRRAPGGSGTGGNGKRQDPGIIWKLLPNKTLEPAQVTLGVTDFTFTELVSGNVNPGDDLVIGQSTNKSSASQTQVRSPVGGPAGATAGVPRRF
jgi:HlyD family secretion protein